MDRICRKAVRCRRCFVDQFGKPAGIDLAQPRWIGPKYWKARPRVILVLLNPGAGNSPGKRERSKPFLRILEEYRDGTVGLSELFEFEKRHMQGWGTPPGRFVRFYIEGLRLDLDEVAFANVAWCAEAKNKYPPAMLNLCFNTHTKRLIQILSPNVIVLSGNKTHRFSQEISMSLPNATVIQTLHYAHRKGRAKEQYELENVRAQMTAARN